MIRNLGLSWVWVIPACLVGLAVGCFLPARGAEVMPHTCLDKTCWDVKAKVKGKCSGGWCIGGIYAMFPKCYPDDTDPGCEDDPDKTWECNGACEDDEDSACTYTLLRCKTKKGISTPSPIP